VDLCAAPGSWTQYCVKRTSDFSDRPTIVAVDLQEMAPIEGATCLSGDITSPATKDKILEHFGNQLADLIICDGAPDVTGLHHIDEFMQSQLLLSALQITVNMLKPGGNFVAKIFRGENLPLLSSVMNIFFDEVICSKPASSRISSQEAFIVCLRLNPPPAFLALDNRSAQNFADFIDVAVRNISGFVPWERQVEDRLGLNLAKSSIDVSDPKFFLPYVACGDLNVMDPDRNYHFAPDTEAIDVVQLPIGAPYRMAKQNNTTE